MSPRTPLALDPESPVSVVVLTRDRRALLERCLLSVARLDPAPLEVIVVDNGSGDGTADWVREQFSAVRILENGDNLGIAGRNRGYREARGDFVLSLDDDVELLDGETLSKVVGAFADDEQAAALSMKIVEEDTHGEFADHHWWHPRDRRRWQDARFETDRINEAAVAFRADVLSEVGYYYEPLFWGGEEWDLVLGIADAGYTIHYLPIPALHLSPRGNLNLRRDPRHVLLVRNRFWIAFRRLAWLDAFAFVLPRAVLWLGRSIRYGYLGHYLSGIGELAGRAGSILRDRRPIARETQRRLQRLRRGDDLSA